jgi:uncharacterized protein (TIGR03083 family)
MDTALARSALIPSYRALTEDVGRMTQDELARPSRCLGWTREDLLFHVLQDAQRALVTLASPAAAEPDVDFVSYWRPFRPGAQGYAEDTRFVRRAAAAYSSGLEIAREWAQTAAAVTHAVGALPDDPNLATQGHVLAVGDFLATLTVEATIHHLDLLSSDPAAEGLAVVRQTLDGILGQPVPAPWDDIAYALKATGRLMFTPDDHELVGQLAQRFPLLG